MAKSNIFLRIFRLLGFVLFYLKEVVLSNIRIAHDILTPRHRMKPGIIAVSLGELSDLQLISLANLVTMTPGTLSLDVSDDRKVLYIHAMYVDDAEALRREIKTNFEQKIKEVF